MKTRGGVKLTKKQIENIKDLEELLKRWDKYLQLNSMGGNLYVMLSPNAKNNTENEFNENGGRNQQNIIDDFNNYRVSSDGGDW